MVQAENVTVTQVYTYTADGLLAARQVNTDVITFIWDLNSPLAQVLQTSDGAQYVHGLDLIAEYRDDLWAYPLGDALGSVRQWTDEDGFITYRGSYTPFGVALSSEGSTSSAWGYTGEWTETSLGDVYLRARWLDVQVGRFTQVDTWEGNRQRPISLQPYLYAVNNPIRYTDPSGRFPWPWDWPAGLVVNLVKASYCKVGLFRFCFNHPDDGQWASDTVDDLFTDFVCEYGEEHRSFNANAHLTRQLARSYTIQQLRWRFYGQGGGYLAGEHSFEGLGFALATLDSISEGDETQFVVEIPQLNITHFLGGFRYNIMELPMQRVRFQVDNTTDLVSGSRIPAMFGGSSSGTSVEQLIAEDPKLSSEPVSSLFETYDIVSILEARRRDPNSILGGGTMEQTFTWCEESPLFHICGMNFLLLPNALTQPNGIKMCP